MNKIRLLAIQEMILNEITKIKDTEPKIVIRIIKLLQMLDKEINYGNEKV